MSDVPLESVFHKRLQSASGWLFGGGIAMLVLGIAAVVFPLLSTIVAELLVGWILLLSGALTLWGSFSIHGTGPFFGALLVSLLSIAAGVFLLFNPLAGVLALTLMLGVIFMVEGAFEDVSAFELRPSTGWAGMLASGIGVFLLFNPLAGVLALTIMLGVIFMVEGHSRSSPRSNCAPPLAGRGCWHRALPASWRLS